MVEVVVPEIFADPKAVMSVTEILGFPVKLLAVDAIPVTLPDTVIF